MFNIQGSEIVFLLLIALVVLGPEKLPDAIRKFTRTYAEFKKVAGGFQGELRQVLDEPMRELRETADAVRQAAVFDPEADATAEADGTAATPGRRSGGVSEIAPRSGAAKQRERSLNFGVPARRSPDAEADTEANDSSTDDQATAPDDQATSPQPDSAAPAAATTDDDGATE